MAGTLTAANILARVNNILQNTGSVRWSSSEQLEYLSDGQREIANFRPDATATHSNVQLVAGTEQSIPTDGLRLISINRNMSAPTTTEVDGETITTPGTGLRAVSKVNLDVINSEEPSWHDPAVTGKAAHGTIVKHYIFDNRDPRKFYVYPGVSGTAYVEVVYSKNPTNLTSTSDTIQVDDIYVNALINFVLYRSFLKESEFAANFERAGAHYQIFTQNLGIGAQLSQATQPEQEAVVG
tara:strand:- start:1914 stop:2630 length:717 start_codon:yes stop_codon:yes gene_type:complete